jgi:hypothetical protein
LQKSEYLFFHALYSGKPLHRRIVIAKPFFSTQKSLKLSFPVDFSLGTKRQHNYVREMNQSESFSRYLPIIRFLVCKAFSRSKATGCYQRNNTFADPDPVLDFPQLSKILQTFQFSAVKNH